MTRYPHFSFPNLFLLNGYKEIETRDGLAIEFEQEDELEQCVRRILVRKPERLRGWDLRFLRRGLGLSQAELGGQVDRDAQTIARWEKSNSEIPRAVDLAVRVRFTARFQPELTVLELVSFVDAVGAKLPASIYLRHTSQGWRFEHEPQVKFVQSAAFGDVYALVGANLGRLAYRLYENIESANSGLLIIEPKGLKDRFVIDVEAKKPIEAAYGRTLLVVKSNLPKEFTNVVALEPSQSTAQKLKVDIKGSVHEYASATIH